MLVNVLLYNSDDDGEGIHSLEIEGKTVVLMFENPDDAERYCGLLEAQDFPLPKVEKIDRDEMEYFCLESGYEARFVYSGFVPESEEDRLLLSPPKTNLDTSIWEDSCENKNSNNTANDSDSSKPNELDEIRNRLEGLL